MELPDNEIHLYFSYPDQISDSGLLEQYESLLTDDERVQMSRLYFARHRHQFLVTRALARTSLSAYFQVEPADWRFGKNAYGKPETRFPEEAGPVRFNISHCEGLIMCGITRHHDIGVDVEDAKRSTQASFESLSSYFSATEMADMADLPLDQQKQRFFDYWTLKESYIKARGMGLSIPLDKFSFRFEADRLNAFETHPDLNDEAADWQFWRISQADRFRVAVAVNSGNESFKLAAFNAVPLKTNDSIQLAFL
jgi:4'-phosphopantetheinyl transferase